MKVVKESDAMEVELSKSGSWMPVESECMS